MSASHTKSASNSRNYYEILNSGINDSIENIKRSYQMLLLRHHPDKQLKAETASIADSSEFHRIDEAWKTLRDPEARRTYDAELNQHKFNEKPIVHETLTLSEFDIDDDNEAYVYACRCGGFYVIDKEGALDGPNDDEVFIACDECSLVVQLVKTR